MNKRNYRIIQGMYLLLALYFNLNVMIYGFIAVLIFEAVTNWRVPMVVNRVRFGVTFNNLLPMVGNNPIKIYRYLFEAERMLRLFVALVLIQAIIVSPEPYPLGTFPWIIAVMILMVGITKICPIVISFRFIGFR